MSRGNAIDRVLNFYRRESLDVVRVTHQLAEEVIASRQPTVPVPRKGRKPKAAVPPVSQVSVEAGHGG